MNKLFELYPKDIITVIDTENKNMLFQKILDPVYYDITKKLMTSTEQVPELMGSMSRHFYFTKVSLIKILINKVKYSSKNLDDLR